MLPFPFTLNWMDLLACIIGTAWERAVPPFQPRRAGSIRFQIRQ